ncbi:Amyloid beta (A4) protein-binding family B member 1 interacting protein [Scophthalmus maximus]|uniref:Amyloid beta (A4) protein-binding family B member 1 interacting protein n=1 Tax=Scophthalmus maximus TaxID=52904 RepID=A0A2U9BLD4_SCOMX|nr:Amyloid beta (A4) protein-binding family B member 1 interacting protein [Scophthalmus maximus]
MSRCSQMEDIDVMFSQLLDEIDHLAQSLPPAVDSPEADPDPHRRSAFSIGFTDLRESLNELEDHDLDALVADLAAKSTPQDPSSARRNSSLTENPAAATRGSEAAAALPRTPNTADSSRGAAQRIEPQTKAEKIKLALEKLREAKVRKVKVSVQVLGVFFSSPCSHTGRVTDLIGPRSAVDREGGDGRRRLQDPDGGRKTDERGFEDHESLVELLSVWTRHNENKIYFVSRPQKYVMFTEPQLFYMWKKKTTLRGVTEHAKQLLLKEHFESSTLVVPDLEGMLFMKEDGKKVWKPRFFVLRASGIYYVPKGKTKSSSDLARFVHFEKVDIYTADNYKQKYRAPTDFCFLLKHPCIQKESPYIKFLCCDSEHTRLLWVNSIRIAKYGTVLYRNYQAAVKVSTLQTLRSAGHTNASKTRTSGIRPQPGPSPPNITDLTGVVHVEQQTLDHEQQAASSWSTLPAESTYIHNSADVIEDQCVSPSGTEYKDTGILYYMSGVQRAAWL